MLEFAILVAKNLGRNRLRTTLTLLAVITLTVIYSVVRTTTHALAEVIRTDGSQNRLIVRERWMFPSNFPRRYLHEISNLPGVEDWTFWNNYAGAWDASNRDDHIAFGVATRVENLKSMHPGLEDLGDGAIEALRKERTGALVGPKLLRNMGLKVGQRFELLGRTHAGKNLQFKIVGVLPNNQWAHSFFFRDDYFAEATGDREKVGLMWLQVRDPETGKRLAAEIERRYANSQDQLRVETESAGAARLASRTSTLVNIVNFVVTVLMVDMVVILANSISITTRERRNEMAILKVLGFQPGFIRSLVIGESMLVGLIGGGLGAALTYAYSWLNEHSLSPVSVQLLLTCPIPLRFVLDGFLMGAGVGFLGSILPAWNAPKVRVVDVFSKVT